VSPSSEAVTVEHRYTFVENDPAGKVDPSGATVVAIPPIIIILVGLGFGVGACGCGKGSGKQGRGGKKGGEPPVPAIPPLPKPDKAKPWQAVCCQGGSFAGTGDPSGPGTIEECDQCCIQQKHPSTKGGNILIHPNIYGRDLRDCLRYCYHSIGCKYERKFYEP
jgi:hypothetical protein